MFRLTDAPLQHGHVLLTASRCQIDHIRNIADDRNIEKTKMGNVVHARQASPEDKNQCRIIVDAEVLRQLVVGALDKGAVDPEHRFSASGSNGRSHGNSLLFGNTHIDKLAPCLLASLRCKAEYSRCTCGDAHHSGILLHLLQQIIGSKVGIVFTLPRLTGQIAGLKVERSTVMKTFFLLFRQFISLAFQGIDMYHNRMIHVLHCAESLYQLFHVITVFHIEIIISHCLKIVAGSLTVRFAQLLQIAV